jgi:hypothetical protein
VDKKMIKYYGINWGDPLEISGAIWPEKKPEPPEEPEDKNNSFVFCGPKIKKDHF